MWVILLCFKTDKIKQAKYNIYMHYDVECTNHKNDSAKTRNIYTKLDLAKLFMNIVVNKVKPTIEKNISPFQIGAIPGHRPEEHLFVLQSIIALAEQNNEAVAAQLLDLVKFFDSEMLVDILNEAYRGQIKAKNYRLIYGMNKTANLT